MSEKYVPLSKLTSPRVRFDNVIPHHVDERRVGINQRAVERLCRLGGIRHLRVTTTSGEMSNFTPTIVGHNEQGEAYAGGKGTRTIVPIYTAHTDQSPHASHRSAANWIDATIQMNGNEIARKIRDDTSLPDGVRSPQGWSRYLNKALKEGIAMIGINHLINGTTPVEVVGLAFVTSATEVLNLLINHTITTGDAIAGIIAGNFAMKINDIVSYRGERTNFSDDEGYRLSFFYGPQVDRAIALGILASTTRLAKALPKQQS